MGTEGDRDYVIAKMKQQAENYSEKDLPRTGAGWLPVEERHSDRGVVCSNAHPKLVEILMKKIDEPFVEFKD
jgi:hypothetical protein